MVKDLVDSLIKFQFNTLNICTLTKQQLRPLSLPTQRQRTAYRRLPNTHSQRTGDSPDT